MATKPKKLPSGSWNVQVYLPNGKRRSITDPLKRVVEQKARDAEAAIRNGGDMPIRDRRLTIEQWAAKWFKARRVEDSTAAKNESHWRNHVKPRWGDWPLGVGIDRLDVQGWVNDMDAAGIGADTIHGAYNLLAKMLGDAVLSKKLHTSPCVEIELPKVVKPVPRWLTRHEYDRVQLALANRTLKVGGGRGGHERPDPQRLTWQAMVALGCFSGLRCPGELAGLDVQHVDLERRQVRVQQVMTRTGLRQYPKTEGSIRVVPFPPEVGDLLWRVIGDRTKGALFTSPSGGRVDEANFRGRVWGGALREAGVEYVRPYVMRHTAASWLVQEGVPPIEIVKMLGHTSMALVNTYLHLAPDQHDKIRAAWGESRERTAYVLHTPEDEESPRPTGRGL